MVGGARSGCCPQTGPYPARCCAGQDCFLARWHLGRRRRAALCLDYALGLPRTRALAPRKVSLVRVTRRVDAGGLASRRCTHRVGNLDGGGAGPGTRAVCSGDEPAHGNPLPPPATRPRLRRARCCFGSRSTCAGEELVCGARARHSIPSARAPLGCNMHKEQQGPVRTTCPRPAWLPWDTPGTGWPAPIRRAAVQEPGAQGVRRHPRTGPLMHPRRRNPNRPASLGPRSPLAGLVIPAAFRLQRLHLFELRSRGGFHLSLTVLVRYRSRTRI